MRLTISSRSIPLAQAVDVNLVQHGVQINLVQQRVNIQRGNRKLDSALDSGLGPFLGARTPRPSTTAPSLRPVPQGKYRCSMRAWTSPFRVSRQIRRVSPDW